MDELAIEVAKHFLERENTDPSYRETIGKTEYGIFLPTPLPLCLSLVKECLEKSIVSSGALFCDAGSGDMRIASLFSSQGVRSIGVEGNKAIARIGKSNAKSIRDLGLSKTELRGLEGNFLDDSTYLKKNYSFESVDCFFNFYNGGEELAEKISDQSKKGTVFIYYSPLPLKRGSLESIARIHLQPWEFAKYNGSYLNLHVQNFLLGCDVRVYKKI